MNQASRPAPGLDKLEWEQLVDEGAAQKDLRISDLGGAADMQVVAFEQNGTHVTITSDLGRARLIELAMSFTAASEATTI